MQRMGGLLTLGFRLWLWALALFRRPFFRERRSDQLYRRFVTFRPDAFDLELLQDTNEHGARPGALRSRAASYT